MSGSEALGVLRERLEWSRAALLRALEGVTEREFAADLGDGRTVVRALAELAAGERNEVARARGLTAGASVPDKPLAPQVVHDLAGARYQTQRLIDESAAGSPTAAERAWGAVETIAAREADLALRIETLKGRSG